METRTIVEGKIYVLWMNPISGRAEERRPVAASSEYDKLVYWYRSQECPAYRDGRMNKNFNKGSVLESYNPIPTLAPNPDSYWHHGIYETWIELDSSGVPAFSRSTNVIYLG